MQIRSAQLLSSETSEEEEGAEVLLDLWPHNSVEHDAVTLGEGKRREDMSFL